MSLRRTLFAFSLLTLPSLAFGGDTVVLSPLLAKGVDSMVVMNVTSLMSSELDFMGNVDGVVELSKSPSNSGCLDSSSCLSGLAKEGGGNKVIAGTITESGGQFVIDLVLYDKARGRVERRREFRLDTNPEAVADGMTAVLQELWTGKTQGGEQDDEPDIADFTAGAASDDDEIDFGEDLSDWDPEAEARADAERTRAEEEERTRRTAAAKAEREAEERKRAEADRKAREEAERARRAEEERAEAKRRQAAQPEPEFDASAISFGDATGEITAEEINDAIQFGSTPQPAPAPRPRASGIDDPDEADRRARMEDLDKPERGSIDRDPASFTIAVRGGGAKYYGLSFVTAGGEVSFALGGSGVAAVIGMETFAANRDVPLELQPAFERTSEWNFIYPLNAGVIYRIDNGGMAVPYIGGDIIGASYFQDPNTEIAGLPIDGKRYNTIGARARLGLDLMFATNVGLNINAAVGGWSGKRWPVVDTTTKAAGLLPQVSAGAIIAF